MSETPPTSESTHRPPSAWPDTLLTTPEKVRGLSCLICFLNMGHFNVNFA